MSSDPMVSVVVPAYNRKELTLRAVRSLLNQDFSDPYEVVVVDDGSTDGTAEAIEGVDERVRVIRQPNRGAAVARHIGVEAARAPVVTFHDSDDLAMPNKLVDLLEGLRSNPGCVASFGIAHSAAPPPGEPKRWWGNDPSDGRMVVVPDPFADLLEVGGPVVMAVNIMTYRHLALEASRDREFYKVANDYDLQLRLAQYGPFVFVASVTCEFEMLAKGLSGTFGAGRYREYALFAAADAFGRARDKRAYRELIRGRVESDWPGVAFGLVNRREWGPLSRVLGIAARHARWWLAPRGFWWELDRLVEERPSEFAGGVGITVRLGRKLRSWSKQGARDRLGASQG